MINRQFTNAGLTMLLMVGLSTDASGAGTTCTSGTVTDQVTTGTVRVEYDSKDSIGNPVVKEVIMIRPTRFVATIIDTVTYDAVTQLYTYKYVVRNDITSAQQIGTVEFAIPPSIPVQSFNFESTSPGWQFFPESNPDGGFSWAFLVGTPRPNTSIEGIPQGLQASFWFASPWAPGAITLYLRGVEPPTIFSPPVPGCVEDEVIDITGFPRDYVAFTVQGPAFAP